VPTSTIKVTTADAQGDLEGARSPRAVREAVFDRLRAGRCLAALVLTVRAHIMGWSAERDHQRRTSETLTADGRIPLEQLPTVRP